MGADEEETFALSRCSHDSVGGRERRTMCNCSRGGKSDLRGQIKAERLSLLLSLHSVDPTLLLRIPVRFSLSCYLLGYAHVAHIQADTRVKSLSLRPPFRLGENVGTLLFFPPLSESDASRLLCFFHSPWNPPCSVSRGETPQLTSHCQCTTLFTMLYVLYSMRQ